MARRSPSAVPDRRSGEQRAAVHVARQAISDADGSLYGYELLFRAASHSTTAADGGDEATTRTILAAFSEFGTADLLGGRIGFLNLTRRFLVGDPPLPFPPGGVVLEVLETVHIDEAVVHGVADLVRAGYRIALDDFVWRPGVQPLLEVADTVKIDVLGTPWDDVCVTADRCRPFGVRLLAEKVEDTVMLQRCLDAGFELFQGYHLARPETLSSRTLSPAHELLFQVLGTLDDPAAGAADVERAVRRDPALVYRLLRIANSAAAGVQREVSSVRDALVMVGLARLRAWLVLLSMGTSGTAAGRTDVALTRARMCELAAGGRGGVRADVAFTVGLLDGVGELLGIGRAELRDRMPSLAPEVDAALAGLPGPLRDLLDGVRAYERRDVASLEDLGFTLADLAGWYLSALTWTTAVTGAAAA